MSCSVDLKFRIGKYPRTLIAIFASSTDFNQVQQDTYISNTVEGYWTEFIKDGQDNQTAPGTRQLNDITAISPQPYSTRLRPVSNLQSLLNQGTVGFLEKIQWVVYDSVDSNADAAFQDPSVVAKIVNSRTAQQPYAQAIYRNSAQMTFQPNFFRPEVLINGSNVYEMMLGSNFGNFNNKGDLSIGLDLPRCDEFYLELNIIKSIQAFAQCGQIIDTGGGVFNLQRYPVKCEMTFWLGSQGTINQY